MAPSYRTIVLLSRNFFSAECDVKQKKLDKTCAKREFRKIFKEMVIADQDQAFLSIYLEGLNKYSPKGAPS